MSNRSKKLKGGCPAKFVLKQNKEISRSVLPSTTARSSSNKTTTNTAATKFDGSKHSNFCEVTYIISGCLTHSHETADTEFDRLTARVRVSIVQLLTLGVPLQTIKDKYLRPEYFGGSNGKVSIFCFAIFDRIVEEYF